MTDYSKFKVLFLVLVYVVCAYTGFQKFYGTGAATQGGGPRQPTIAYSVCDKLMSKVDINDNDKRVRCKKGVDRANTESKIKCAQYFSQLVTCRQRTRAPCQTQLSNFENCVNTILTQYVEEELGESGR